MAKSVQGSSEVTDVTRNVMLYWDAYPFPPDVIAVSETWRKHCPEWKVTLFNQETARLYLQDVFGGDIVRLFLTCALPAMRSDFFRVLWAVSEGGIYSDVTFVPKRAPLFFNPEKDLTVTLRPSGKKRGSRPNVMIPKSNIFFAKKGCMELKLIAFEQIKEISKREIPTVWDSVGTEVWVRTIDQNDNSAVEFLDWKTLRDEFIENSNYPSHTRKTDLHWTRLQKKMSIYQDPLETKSGKP